MFLIRYSIAHIPFWLNQLSSNLNYQQQNSPFYNGFLLIYYIAQLRAFDRLFVTEKRP